MIRRLAKKKWSFFSLFLTVAVGVLFIGFNLIHMIAKQQTESLYQETIQNEIKALSQSGVKTMIARLDSVISKAKGLKKLVLNSIDNPFDDEKIIRLMTGYIEGDSSLEACYILDDKGNYLYTTLNRGLPSRKTFDEMRNENIKNFDNKASISAKFILKRIHHDPEKPSGYVEYRDDNADLVAKKVLSTNDFLFDELYNYDSRMLPAFQKAKKTRQSSWSNIYVYIKGFSTSRLGVAYNEPVFDTSGIFLGVVGLDYNVKSFSHVLRDCQISPHTESFVVDQKGDVYGLPNEDEVYILTQESTSVNNLKNLKNPVSQIAFSHYQATGEKEFHITHEGADHIAYFEAFPEGYGNKLVYGVVVPKKDFLGPLQARNRIVLGLELVVIFFFLMTMALLVRWLTRPFEQLSREMQLIQDFTIERGKPINSPTIEVSMIADALEHMKNGLEAFGRFVPKALVRQLISNGHNVVPGGEKRNLTVMFSDIRGFTTISDQCSADVLTGHLSDYMTQLSHLIEENQGTIDKYIGDAIMAFWGAPTQDLEHAEHACLSLLLCRSKLHELNQIWKIQGKPEMLTRFGLSAGEVIVGNFGSDDRLNYTIIGSTVNLASRLEKLNKKYGTEILVSDSVIFAVGSRFIFRPVDFVVVRGKTNSCMVYELMGENKDGKHFPITDEQLVLKGLTELAFTLFRQGHWERSLKSWLHIHKLYPNDSLAKIYIERCNEFIKKPPEDWDGITRLGED